MIFNNQYMMNGYYRPPPAGREYICGLYYIIPSGGWRLEKNYLPQIELQAHATILATTSRTVLTQTFVNPSTKKGIKECRYTFPLYDGVSVVGFTCHIGDRTIIGEVKEREKARAVFQQAVARGETAGLLEQLPDASDVFTTTVGNVPPGAKVIIKVTYLGELKHDMEVDGIRFTIPNTICPRYGNYPGTLRTSPATGAMGGSISIIVDAEMADGSFIQKIQSPTHPIAVTMGTTSLAPNAEPTMTKASATLTLGTTMLDTDFVLQVIAKDTGIPKAILECHPTIPNHRALMATLVPKFALPPEKPEIVFVCDRSGSMDGSRIDLAIQALKVFLKSLPIGVKFNICSFGSRHSFLWQKSVTYTQQTLDEAVRHAETFSANYGGTEMLEPLRATIEQRYKDMPLEVMMLTDGKTWNQQQLFTYLNSSVTESKAPIRVFTLGIGDGVSHALIESMAKAGNGFSQTVGDNEKMDSKVVRMLKGALSPHINDYSLEVNYSVCPTAKDDDDFEIIERVADSLKIKLDLSDKEDTKKETKKQISLFDTSADPDKEEPPVHDATGENRYAHLPKFPAPKIVQAPQNIPSLFAFNRTTVYLLLGPDAPQAMPKSVILRGTSAYGPLELEIPIHFLDLPGETIHQLAAKRAISELEQGRGWLSEAKDETGAVIKTKFEGRFDDMVEREAVRLGVKFQVGGKWCSFVAVESNKKNLQAKEKEEQEWEWLEDEREENISQADRQNGSQLQSLEQGSSLPPQDIEAIKARMDQLRDRGDLPSAIAPSSGFMAAQGMFCGGEVKKRMESPLFRGQFGSSNPAAPEVQNFRSGLLGSTRLASRGSCGGMMSARGGNLFGTQANQQQQRISPMTLEQQNKNQLFMGSQESGRVFSSGFAPAPPPAAGNQLEGLQSGTAGLGAGRGGEGGGGLLGGGGIPGRGDGLGGGEGTSAYMHTPSLLPYKIARTDSNSPPLATTPKSEEEVLHYLIGLQTFEGCWEWSNALNVALTSVYTLDQAQLMRQVDSGVDTKLFATALVVMVFEEKLAKWKGSWELVVEKARVWLEGEFGVTGLEKILETARNVVK